MDLRPRLPALLLALLAARAASADSPVGSISGQVVVADAAGPVLVYLADLAPSAKERASRRSLPRLRVELRGRQFLPPYLIVKQGQFVEFVNRDRGYHSIFSLSPGNEFDLGLDQDGEPLPVELRAPGEVEIFCDLHADMAARILVLQNEHLTQVGPAGSYVLRDVPVGAHTLVVWSPWLQPERRRLRVSEGTTAQADFALRPRRTPEGHVGRRGRAE